MFCFLNAFLCLSNCVILIKSFLILLHIFLQFESIVLLCLLFNDIHTLLWLQEKKKKKKVADEDDEDEGGPALSRFQMLNMSDDDGGNKDSEDEDVSWFCAKKVKVIRKRAVEHAFDKSKLQNE